MPTSAEVEAEQHYARQAALAVLAQQAARKAWARVDPARLDSWVALARPLLGTISVAQYAAAADAARYIPAALKAQGLSTAAAAELVPAAFAGVASDGRDLASLLDQPRIRVLTRIGEGVAPREAMASGLAQLETITVTQVQDAGRSAAGVAIAARPHVAGYIRHLRPPSCSRCAVLAGQFYRWNAGFLRHPRCDCRHVPVSSAELYRDEVTSPKAYFDSLSRAEQDRVFTNAGARAIRDGADLTQVVNARRGMRTANVYGREVRVTTEGTTRRGVAGKLLDAKKTPRLMPEQIYADATDRADAIRLLERHGYVRASAGPGGPGPRVPRPSTAGGSPGGAAGRPTGVGGGGTPPLRPGGVGSEGPSRALPRRERPPQFPERVETPTFDRARWTYEELEASGRILPDWSTFSAEERRVAEHLRAAGVDVMPVARDNRTDSPDAVVVAARVTVEIKTPRSVGAVEKRFVKARHQSPRMVLDLRATGIGRDQAVRDVARWLRRYGGVEELLVLGDGYELSWP